jgi:hypothetical protein
VIALECDGTVAIVDPAHGGEVLDLVGPSGARPLGRPPFGPLAAREGELDEDDWTDRYRGGWQLAAPNAGNVAQVDGTRHGFHGGASAARWTVVARTCCSVDLMLDWGALRFERHLRLRSSILRVETSVTTVTEVTPMIALEHIACGASVLSPAANLYIAPGHCYEVDDLTGPVSTPPNAPLFPRVLGIDGSVEDGSSWPIERKRARLLVVADVPVGLAEIQNSATGEGLRLRWDETVLPHVWVWHELRASGGRWREAAELLGIEPAMVPHPLGLAEAIMSGHACTVVPGVPLFWWLEAELLPSGLLEEVAA